MSAYPLLRDTLFALSKHDAERAHEMAMWALARISGSRMALGLSSWLWEENRALRKPYDCMGIRFPGRVGLAAGLDKNAAGILALATMGFGFIEVGTVLPFPQHGNPRPRLFRYPDSEALVNRMGFNSEGMHAAAARLRRITPSIPLGISIGKMKDTQNEKAGYDYTEVAYHTRRLGKYLAANVSSPNTPGLRDLQKRDAIRALVRQLISTERQRSRTLGLNPRPVLVKVAPDLTLEEHQNIIETAAEEGAKGFIVANTTTRRDVLGGDIMEEVGGYSGPDLLPEMLRRVAFTKKLVPNLAVIGVGGIQSGEDARRTVEAGADLIQILTSFVYRGPSILKELNRAIR